MGVGIQVGCDEREKREDVYRLSETAERRGWKRRWEREKHTIGVYQGYWAIRHTLHSYATPNELLFLATKCFSSSFSSSSSSPFIHSMGAISWRVIPIILEISMVDSDHSRLIANYKHWFSFFFPLQRILFSLFILCKACFYHIFSCYF